MQVALRFKVSGSRLEVWEGDRLIRSTTVDALADVVRRLQRGRQEVSL